MQRFLFVAIGLFLPASLLGQETKQDPNKEAAPVAVPYRLTDTQHVMVRVKINDKGPFNFIVDTGAPIMFFATGPAKKMGLEPKEKALNVLDKVEIEGGLVLTNVKCRIETPFQLEGMNGMGLAGTELHGILGYTVLAKYRMHIDLTKKKMQWTPLAFDPPPPQPIKDKGNSQAGLEMIGTLMKFIGLLSGMKPAGPPQPRGSVGIELAEKDDAVVVTRVLEQSPAANAGLKAQDRILQVGKDEVKTIADVRRHTATVLAGQTVRLVIGRGDEKMEVELKAGEGL